MTFVETNIQLDTGLTTRQRWSHYFVIAFGIIAFLIAFNLRQNTLNASSIYINNETGIVASYPENWLLDESNSREYVFRVQNIHEIGFKTTLQVSILPIGNTTTRRTTFDILSMRRAQTLSSYRTIFIGSYDLPNNDIDATSAIYTYVDTNQNPFLESTPIVVTGIDILALSRGQAIIITMLSDARKFEENQVLFDRFVSALEF